MKKSNRLFKFVAVFSLSALLLSCASCTEEKHVVSELKIAEQNANEIEIVNLSASNEDSDVKVNASNEDSVITIGASTVEMVEVPVFTRDIAAGERIAEEDVTAKSVRADAVPSTLAKSVKAVVGKYAKMQLYKGDFAYSAKLSTKSTENAADASGIEKIKNKYIDVSLFVEPNTGADLHAVLQKIVEENPKRTLYFPDGEYIISKPLKLSAVPAKSTSIYLADNAVIKASNSWMSESNALITVGVTDETMQKSQNDITSLGSNYFIMGGTLDVNRKATGIKIDAGREILISKIKIVNATVGINIPYGINNGSSDIDVEDIDIIGYGSRSKGMVIEGYDNNVVDVRITDVATGIQTGNGNFFRGVSVKLTENPSGSITYGSTIGFQINSGNNWFYSCSTENVATAFSVGTASDVIIKDFSIRWTRAQGAQTAFRVTTRRFAAICSNGIIDFYDASTDNSILAGASNTSGNGMFLDVIVDTALCDNQNHEKFFYTSKIGA